MSTESSVEGVKPRKRKPAKPQPREDSPKIKTTISLTVEASRRLSVHAAMMGKDRSELMELLITTHLRRYVVSDRGGEANGEGAAEGE